MFPSWISRLFVQTTKPSRRQRRAGRPATRSSFRPLLETLEDRMLLSAALPLGNEVAQPTLMVPPQQASPQGTPGNYGYTPQQIRQAYGVSTLLKAGTNGKGQTIAIVDAYNDPDIINDVKTFDTQFGSQQFNVSGGPSLKVVATGGGSPSKFGTNGDWAGETSLDVEWAHSIAPQANILLVEAPNEIMSSLYSAAKYAAAQKGVVVVSMSWGIQEQPGESSNDSNFVPPRSNPGVTFVAAAGDFSAYYGPIYPATSPYVLAVGGTSLSLTSTNNYSSESAWDDGGGGAASYEGEPSYQYKQASIGSPDVAVTNIFSGVTSYYSARLTPDVAYNADPYTGFAVYDSIAYPAAGFKGGWTEYGGTSAGAPQWSALIALTDQVRVAEGGKPLDTNEVQNTLYNTLGTSNYSKIFHDITTGSNGYSAIPGYDTATGLGTPIANNLVPFLAKSTIPLGQLPSIKGSGIGPFNYSSSSSSVTVMAVSGQKSGGGLYSSTGSLSITPIAQSITRMDGPTAAAEMGTSNFDGNISMLAPAAPSAPAGTTSPAASMVDRIAHENILFGASGWNGSAEKAVSDHFLWEKMI